METVLLLACGGIAIAAVVMTVAIIVELAKISEAYSAKMREAEDE